MRRVKRRESARAIALPATAEALGQLVLDLLSQRNDTTAVAGPTFGELAQEWLEWVTPRRVDPRVERRLVGHLTGLAEETEGTLTALKIEDYLEGVRRRGGYGARYANHMRDAGGKILRHAQRTKRWRGVNPFALAKPQRVPPRQYEVLTEDELRRAQWVLSGPNRRLFRVALHVGLRSGELFALRKEDVDLQALTILVRRSHGRDATKTGRNRVVPIVPAIEEDVREAMRLSRCELVFPNHLGRRHRRQAPFAQVLQRALVRIGIPEARASRVRWYDLRHMAATYHHRAKADPLCVALVLGHSVKGTTHQVYTHPSSEMLRAELSRWSLSR